MSKKSKRLKRRARRQRSNPMYYLHEDYHHFCWIHKATWGSGWKKRLREHEYTGAYLPQMTLHKYIHMAINNISAPDENTCRQIYYKLNAYLMIGKISLTDTPMRKLEVLYELTKEKSPATAKGFKQQLDIINEFYNKEAT